MPTGKQVGCIIGAVVAIPFLLVFLGFPFGDVWPHFESISITPEHIRFKYFPTRDTCSNRGIHLLYMDRSLAEEFVSKNPAMYAYGGRIAEGNFICEEDYSKLKAGSYPLVTSLEQQPAGGSGPGYTATVEYKLAWWRPRASCYMFDYRLTGLDEIRAGAAPDQVTVVLLEVLTDGSQNFLPVVLE